MSSWPTQLLLACALLAGSVSGSGCRQLMFIHQWKLARLPVASPEHPVVEIICLWEPGEGTGLDGLPCRGFAGQLMFFASGITSPVRVDGSALKVYVFDDQGTPEEQERPIHEFDFDAGAFKAFLMETNIGAAYQLFIPYSRKGNHKANCSVRVRITPEKGSPIYSKMAAVILPGTSPRKPDVSIEQELENRASRVVRAEFQAPAEAPSRMRREAGIELASGVVSHSVESLQEDKSRLHSRLKDFTSQQPVAPSPAETPAPTKLLRRQDAAELFGEKPISPTPEAAAAAPSRHPLLDD